MKTRIKYVSLLIATVFIIAAFLLIVLQTTSNQYSYDDIPRRYITGEITSISQEDKYLYLNSGVLLIDYDKWRNLKGTNSDIVKDLFEVLKTASISS